MKYLIDLGGAKKQFKRKHQQITWSWRHSVWVCSVLYRIYSHYLWEVWKVVWAWRFCAFNIYFAFIGFYLLLFLRLQVKFVASRIFKDWYYKGWVWNRAVHLWVFGSGLTPVQMWTAGTLELRFCAITRAVRLDRSANGSSIHRTAPVHTSRALLYPPAAGEMRQTDSEHCWSAPYLHTWRLTCWAVRAGTIGYY